MVAQTNSPCIVRVRGVVQHYAWGSPAYTSLVAAVSKAQNENCPDSSIDPDTPCAELWLGAHPSAPAQIVGVSNKIVTRCDKQTTLQSSEQPTTDSSPVPETKSHQFDTAVSSQSNDIPQPTTEKSKGTDTKETNKDVNWKEEASNESIDIEDGGSAEDATITGKVVPETTEPEKDEEEKLTSEGEPNDSSSAQNDQEKPGSLPGDLATWLADKDMSMPYLFKILSIARPLSLQLHPDIQNAAKMHQERPDIYKDPNDKPEMAFVVSKTFKLMCGFRKPKEVSAFVELLPPLSFLLKENVAAEGESPRGDENEETGSATKKSMGKSKTEEEAAFLKLVMKNLYATSAEDIQRVIGEVRDSFEAHFEKPETTKNGDETTVSNEEKDGEKGSSSNTNKPYGVAALGGMFESVVKSLKNFVTDDNKHDTKTKMIEAYRTFELLKSEYPGDRGVFAPFILNCAELRSGDCISIKPNTIHAYLSGDCLECMKSSDNVIRAGLTPKYQDVEKLLELVEYKSTSISNCIVKGQDVSFTCPPKNISSSRIQCRAIIPTITDAFRFYILRILRTQPAVVNVQIPQWAPVICMVLKGKGEIVVNEKEGNAQDVRADVSAGQALAISNWYSISARNTYVSTTINPTDTKGAVGGTNEKSPSNSSSHSQLLHSCELSAQDFATSNDSQSADLLIIFVTPNNDTTIRKRPTKEFKTAITSINNNSKPSVDSLKSPRKPSVTQSTLIESTGTRY